MKMATERSVLPLQQKQQLKL